MLEFRDRCGLNERDLTLEMPHLHQNGQPRLRVGRISPQGAGDEGRDWLSLPRIGCRNGSTEGDDLIAMPLEASTVGMQVCEGVLIPPMMQTFLPADASRQLAGALQKGYELLTCLRSVGVFRDREL
jgi:hypothetical protein